MKKNIEIESLKQKILKTNNVVENIKLTLNLAEKFLFIDLEESKRLAENSSLKAVSINNKLLEFKSLLIKLRVLRALNQYEKAFDLAVMLKNNIIKKTDVIDQFLVYNSLINILINKLDFKTSYQYCVFIYENFYIDLPSRYQAHYHTDFGKVNEKLSYTDMAIEEYEKGLNIFEEINDLNGKAKCIFSVGLLYFNLEKFKEALPYFTKTLEIDLKLNSNNPIIVLQSYAMIAKCQFLINKFTEGLENLNKAIGLANQSKNSMFISRMLCEKTVYFQLKKEYQKCIDLSLELLNNSELEKDSFFYFQTLDSLGIAYKETNKNKKALECFDKCLPEYIKTNQVSSELNTYLYLFETHKKIGNLEMALDSHIKYVTLLIKIQKEKEKNALEQFEVKFKTADKEKEAEKHKTESLKFQLQSLRSQMNPHFVFNAISSISSHLKEDNIENSKHLLNSFARLMRSNLEFAETEKITLEEEIKFLTDYLNLEKNRLGNKLNFKINYSKNLDIDFIEIPSMLLQPYIENSIKHGIMPLEKDGLITIDLQEKEDVLICTIEDNGIGRKAVAEKQKNKEKHLGKSTKITETRLALLSQNGKDIVKVKYTDLKENKGTKVIIKINI